MAQTRRGILKLDQSQRAFVCLIFRIAADRHSDSERGRQKLRETERGGGMDRHISRWTEREKKTERVKEIKQG